MRRKVISVVGDAGALPGTPTYDAAHELGRRLVDAGHRVMTGGLHGVMEAACKGAHASASYREGDTIGILPRLDPEAANPWADIVIATGLDHARNTLVANADAVIAVGGGAGTLSEIAFAWVFKRLVIAIRGPGWGDRLADQKLDGRARCAAEAAEEDRVFAAVDAEHAVALVGEKLPLYAARNGGFRDDGR